MTDPTPHADPAEDGEKRTRASDMLEQYGRDALRLAEKLADVQSDNYSLREKNRALRQQVTEAAGKVPAGSVVLSAEDAQALEAYRALGKPEDVKTKLESLTPVQQELHGLKRERAITKAAEAAGFKPAVLNTLAGDLDIQVKPGQDGKPLAVVVKDGAETALTDFAKAEWAEFLPALAPVQAQPQPYDINAGARGANGGHVVTEAERLAIADRYRTTF